MTVTDMELLEAAVHAVAACHVHRGDPHAVERVLQDVERTRARVLEPLPEHVWSAR
ncbi:hypothetical protein [Microbacterium xylanilyticum]